jgi:hypothetical protein
MTENYVKRPAGPNVRTSAMLIRRKAKLTKILNSGKIVRKGVEKPITEVEIEKYGFQLERCEKEIASIRQKVVKA